MNNKQMISAVIVVIVVVAAIAAVVYSTSDDSSSDGRTVTDSRGRTVEVPDSIDSILCLSSCSLELVSYFDSVEKVSALDSDDSIVGTKTYTQVHSDLFSSLPVVDSGNAEQIIQLSPSIVISSTIDVADLDQMQSTYGIPVYAINADLEFGSDAWFDQIIALGELLGEEDRAQEIVSGVRGIITDITSSQVSGVTGYTCGMMFYGQGSFIKTSGDWLPFTFSGVTNVMDLSTDGVGGQPYNTTIENVLAEDFDYIFIDGSNYESVLNEIRGYIDTTTLGEKTAIQNGDVYKVLVYKIWGTQWDAQLINCLYVASIVGDYDWDFEDKANEVLQILYGDDVDYTYQDIVDAQGGCMQLTV